MDYIHVNDMEFWGYHGVFAEETKLGQRFRVTFHWLLIYKKPVKQTILEKTVNYAEAFFICQKIVEGEPVKLSGDCGRANRNRNIDDSLKELVKGCKVMLIKPDPPIPGHYRSVAVEITRGTYV